MPIVQQVKLPLVALLVKEFLEKLRVVSRLPVADCSCIVLTLLYLRVFRVAGAETMCRYAGRG